MCNSRLRATCVVCDFRGLRFYLPAWTVLFVTRLILVFLVCGVRCLRCVFGVLRLWRFFLFVPSFCLRHDRAIALILVWFLCGLPFCGVLCLACADCVQVVLLAACFVRDMITCGVRCLFCGVLVLVVCCVCGVLVVLLCFALFFWLLLFAACFVCQIALFLACVCLPSDRL